MSARWVIFICFALIVASSIIFFQPSNLTGNSSKSILIVGLVNLNLVLLTALAFVVGRNILKLFFDRKNKILGSKLRQRLVFAFLALTLVPTIIMFVLASGLINRASSGWFSSQVESLVDDAISVSQLYLDQQKDIFKKDAVQVRTLVQNQSINQDFSASLDSYLSELRNKYNLYSIVIFDSENKPAFQAESIVNEIDDLAEPIINTDIFQTENIIEPVVLLESKGGTQFLRFYNQFLINELDHVLVVTKRFDAQASQKLSSLQAGYREYGQLKFFKTPLTASYLLTMALITGVIIFSAIWYGFYLAREISEPLHKVSEGTKQVASGHYDIQINTSGDDELTELTKSFNQMVVDLKQSQEEINLRRVYTETILNNLAVGVIGLSPEYQVMTINKAAERIFSWEDLRVDDVNIETLFEQEGSDDLKEFILSSLPDSENNDLTGHEVIQKQLDVIVAGSNKSLIVTVGRVKKVNQPLLGIVILVDDITDLIQAQKISAWREVARRLAHELKNPLTPIKLSAQRLKKNADTIQPADISNASKTIVEHVDTIKILIDEFAKYARLPVAELAETDLGRLIESVVDLYVNKNPDIKISVYIQEDLPLVPLNPDQIRRCMINLVENSIASIEAASRPEGNMKVICEYDGNRFVKIEVIDNGTGIKNEDKPRIFDPYFTTKEMGTGLGLSIVASIIADHQGRIRVLDEEPQGTRFIIELPADYEQQKPRRYGS